MWVRQAGQCGGHSVGGWQWLALDSECGSDEVVVSVVVMVLVDGSSQSLDSGCGVLPPSCSVTLSMFKASLSFSLSLLLLSQKRWPCSDSFLTTRQNEQKHHHHISGEPTATVDLLPLLLSWSRQRGSLGLRMAVPGSRSSQASASALLIRFEPQKGRA